MSRVTLSREDAEGSRPAQTLRSARCFAVDAAQHDGSRYV